MKKLNIITRQPRISDFNNIIYTINDIIDKLNQKVKFQDIQIAKVVKDYNFFKEKWVKLPYDRDYVVTCLEELYNILDTYNVDREMTKTLIDTVTEWYIVNLSIHIEEDVSEKEKKQEEMFETIKAQPVEEVAKEIKKEKKKWRPKKDKTNDKKWKQK